MVWIFQAVPKRYDLRTEMEEGGRETWLVTRYGDEMKRGDIVYFWLAGKPGIRGLYGWGRIASDGPKERKGWGKGVDVKYEKVFASHIPSSSLASRPELRDHLLFRVGVGTNFKVTAEEHEVIKEVVSQLLGEEAIPHE
jgi:hypothetical protein